MSDPYNHYFYTEKGEKFKLNEIKFSKYHPLVRKICEICRKSNDQIQRSGKNHFDPATAWHRAIKVTGPALLLNH